LFYHSPPVLPGRAPRRRTKETYMKTFQLLENLSFRSENAIAEPLAVDEQGRVLRFMLEPWQVIREHKVPSSPFYVFILQGRGVFTGDDGVEQTVGPHTLLTFAPGETHSVRALDEALVFVGLLQSVPEELHGRRS
jgi:quercetin dioxygenase-like cupin family protein